MPRMAWLRDVPDLWRREPMLTGRVGGALYIGAGLYALLLLVLPGHHAHAPRARRCRWAWPASSTGC